MSPIEGAILPLSMAALSGLFWFGGGMFTAAPGDVPVPPGVTFLLVFNTCVRCGVWTCFS